MFRCIVPLGLSFLLFTSFVFATPTPPKKAVVFTKKAEKIQISERLTYPAQVAPSVHSQILAETEGVLTQVFTPLGTQVKKGQKLFVLKNPDPIYQYAPVTVRAPITGVISEVHASKGSQLQKGQKLATITDPDQLKIRIEITATDLMDLSSGMPASFEVAGRDEKRKIQVSGMSPFVDPSTGTASTELKFISREETKGIRPGMVGRVEFQIRPHEGFLIPLDSLSYNGDQPQLRVIENGKVKKIDVTLGTKKGNEVEIQTGLSVGQEVVIRSNQYLADGEEVEIFKPEKEENQKPEASSS